MKFIDQTEILIAAGNGGDGMISFRAARNKPKLGPDGGNGGNGGDVIFTADAGLNTLSRFRYRQSYQAEHGGKGGSNDKTGRCGAPKLIPVPLGTIIFDAQSGDKLGEILKVDDQVIGAKGGRRGYGNRQFVLPTRQAPDFSTAGKKGESRHIKLELKLIADIGLAGFPNAGKSTLLSVLSAAKPKIGDYPFTTLTPNLGVVDVGNPESDLSSFVVADIPGLIEGASQGKGLGLEFLRHIERTKIIAFVIDGFAQDHQISCLDTYQMLIKELECYSQELLKKRRIIIINKIDAASDRSELAKIAKAFEEKGLEVVFVSGATKENIEELKWKLHALLISQSQS